MTTPAVPQWMGPEAVQFLGDFLPRHADILDQGFDFLHETRITMLQLWHGKVKRAVEIGVCRGEYSKCILDALKPEQLVLIDSWDTHDPNYPNAVRQRENMEHTRFRFASDSRVQVIQDESGDALPKFDPGHFDWAFVDGDHRFHWVLVDLIMCDRVVNCNGVISGHDFSSLFGVPAAVAEFCRHYPWRLVSLTPGPHSTFVLQHLPS